MSALTIPTSRPTPAAGAVSILVADDNLIDRRVVSRVLQQQEGAWDVRFVKNGVEALESLASDPTRLVLTDLQMPRMDGLTLVEQIRERYPGVPVVLMTGTGSGEIAVQALRGGAASYVPKRNLATALLPPLAHVVEASQIDEPRQRMLARVTQQDIRLTLPPAPFLVPLLAAMLRENLLAMGLCDRTGATRAGIALEEALLNAVYHGSLELPAGLRQQDETAFNDLAEQRRAQTPYRDRRIRLFVNVTLAEAVYVVFDQGPGFDTTKLPDPAVSADLQGARGRGVVLMRAFMDRVTYTKSGNQVTLLKKREVRGGRP